MERTRLRRAAATTLALAGLVGCSEGAATPADAAPELDASVCSARVTSGGEAPVWDCPDGWVAHPQGGCAPAVLVVDGGVTGGFHRAPDGAIAGPWPDEGFAPDAGVGACPEGWSASGAGCDPALRPSAGCPAQSTLPAGRCALSPCEGARWPASVPDGALYVDPRAGERPDGSRERPYPTLSDAMRAAGDGATIALAAGEHAVPGDLAPARDVAVLGACPEGTTLRIEGALRLDRPVATRWSNLRLVTGDAGVGVSNGTTTWRGLWLLASRGGVNVAGAGARVVVEGARIESPEADVTLHAVDAARVTARDLSLVGAVVAEGGASVSLTDAVIDGQGASGRSRGLRAVGAAIAATRTVVEQTADHAVYAEGAGGSVELTDSVVRDVRGGAGHALHARMGGAVEATRVTIEGADGEAAYAESSGRLRLVASSIAPGARLLDANAGGYGVAIEGAELDATALRVDGAMTRTVSVVGSGAHATLTDCWLRRARPTPGTRIGVGVGAYRGAQVTMDRVRIEGMYQNGIKSTDPGTRVDVTRSVVLDTRTDFNMGGAGWLDEGGAGLAVDRASMTAREVLVARSEAVGVTVAGELTLTDSAVLDTTLLAPIGRGGIGIAATRNSPDAFPSCGDVPPTTLAAERVLVAGVREMGLAAYGPATRVQLRDVIVADAVPSVCGFGVGVGVAAGARIDAQRLAIARVSGAAFGAIAGILPGEGCGASVAATDLFATQIGRSVVSSTVLNPACEGAARSYGVSVGRDCSVELQRAVMSDGGFGFFVERGARSFRVQRGVIAGMCEAGGATQSGDVLGALALDRVRFANVGALVIERSDLEAARMAVP